MNLEGWIVERSRRNSVFRAAFHIGWHLKNLKMQADAPWRGASFGHFRFLQMLPGAESGSKYAVRSLVACSPFYCPPFHLLEQVLHFTHAMLKFQIWWTVVKYCRRFYFVKLFGKFIEHFLIRFASINAFDFFTLFTPFNSMFLLCQHFWVTLYC